MTSRLMEALHRMEGAFTKSGAPTMQYLRPGISVDQHEEILRPTGLQLSSSLGTLRSWRNGTCPADGPETCQQSIFGHRESRASRTRPVFSGSVCCSGTSRWIASAMNTASAQDRRPRYVAPQTFVSCSR